MKQRVLVADDSLTIQKVIKITLSNEPFELEECHEDKTLLEQVKSSTPQIILLDFNLSESKTGYDLAREIKEIVPESKILMLYGTFDTIDEDLLSTSGCDYHITKPFDGNKFIQLCRSMLSDSELEKDDSTDNFEIPEELNEEEIPASIDDSLDDWVVNQPEPIEEIEDEIPAPIQEVKNVLEESIEEWTMEVPGQIGTPDVPSIGDIPSVIPEMPEPIVDVQEVADELPAPIDNSKLPSNDDLSFPDDDDLSYPDDMDTIDIEDSIEIEEPVSNLIPLDDLSPSIEMEIETNHEEPTGIKGTETDEQVDSLKQQIQDELDDDDLWEIDEFEGDDVVEPSFEPLDSELIEHIDEDNIVSINQTETPSDFPEDVMKEETQIETIATKSPAVSSSTLTQELEDKLVNQLFEKFKPLIMQRVEDICKESVEKVSWDVIPDLAENIIQKELAQITKKIMGEDEE